jgi:hypothetical protein
MAQGPWDTGTWDSALWDSLPITGNAATGSPGSVSVGSIAVALTGNAATGQVGTVTPNLTIALTGVSATGQVGTEGDGLDIALTGASATGQVGTVVNGLTIAITGVSATGEVGTVTVPVVPIIIDDTHDGDYHKKKFDEERAKAKQKRANIVHAYERLVEGKPDVAEEIAAPYVKPANKKHSEPLINYDKLLADTDRANRLWQAYLEMDDEEVLLLL